MSLEMRIYELEASGFYLVGCNDWSVLIDTPSGQRRRYFCHTGSGLEPYRDFSGKPVPPRAIK